MTTQEKSRLTGIESGHDKRNFHSIAPARRKANLGKRTIAAMLNAGQSKDQVFIYFKRMGIEMSAHELRHLITVEANHLQYEKLKDLEQQIMRTKKSLADHLAQKDKPLPTIPEKFAEVFGVKIIPVAPEVAK